MNLNRRKNFFFIWSSKKSALIIKSDLSYEMPALSHPTPPQQVKDFKQSLNQ